MDSTVTLSCVDALEPLNQVELGGESYPEELSGARIDAILSNSAFASADRIIDAGQSQVAAIAAGDYANRKSKEAPQETADTELGYIFISAEGSIIFHDRHHRLKPPYNVSQGIFGDQAGELPYRDLVPTYDKQQIINDVRVTPASGAEQVSVDATSQAAYFVRSESRTTLLTSTQEAQDQANYLVLKRKGT